MNRNLKQNYLVPDRVFLSKNPTIKLVYMQKAGS